MALPAVLALAGLTFAVLAKDLLGYTDLIVNRGLGVGAVALIAFHQSVPLAAAMLPFAVLIGCLAGLGRLAAERELLALETCGIAPVSLARPVFGFVVIAGVPALLLSLFAAPWSHRALEASLRELASSRPSAVMHAGEVQSFGDWKIEAREANAAGDRIRAVLLWVPEFGRTLFAERGSISLDPDGGTRLVLERGGTLVASPEGPYQLRFTSLTTRLPASDETLAPDDRDGLDGAPLRRLLQLSGSGAAPDALRARVVLHRRVALPLATLIFGVLALPLSIRLRTRSRSSGGVAGILVAIAYYGLVQLGDGLIEGGTASAALGVWLPNAVMATLALALLFDLARRPPFVHDTASRGWLHGLRAAWRRRWGPTGSRAGICEMHLRRHALQRYVARRFLDVALASFAVLVVGYLLVDMLERLEFFARHSTSGAELTRYYAARVPLLASRVLPMALLVATALTAGLLAVENELTGMRGCGLAPARVLSVILWPCVLIAPAAFVLGDQVVPRTESIAHEVKTEVKVRDRSGGGPETSAAREWYRVGQRLYEMEQLDPLEGTARKLRVYEIGADALPTRLVEAQHASHLGDGVWRLRDSSEVEVAEGMIRRRPGPEFVELDSRPPGDVSTIRMSVGELRGLIRDADRAGLDSTRYRVDLWRKLATPLACMLLPVLALLFATGGPPYPAPPLTLLAAFTVAVSYVLLTGISTSLGYGRILPPVISGAAPIALLALLAPCLWLRVPDLRS